MNGIDRHSVLKTIQRICISLSISFFIVSISFPQKRVSYEISFPNAVHHEAEVIVRFTGLPQKTLEVRMSRSSPGRYALHEFAKNVYNVSASDGKGNPLPITNPDPSQWNISNHDGTVVVKYTLYGDHADGTYVGIDKTHAHLNMPAAFMWARGLDEAPIRITFDLPKESKWKITTQLAPTDRSTTFTAPNFQYFMDCPAELSDYTMRQWQTESAGKTPTIRLAVHHDGTEQEVDAYAEMAKVAVDEEMGVFGELAPYDYGEYTFIADYLPSVRGDGMEHRNSTIIVSTKPLRTNAVDNLGTLTHEFFHSWNVERIRPKSLEPFNFEGANMSGELWFAEGITSYYSALIMARAELISLDRFAERIGSEVNHVINDNGRLFFSAVGMSEQAPFVDAATSVDETNRANTFISYYTYGTAIGLALDLRLRTKFPGLSLDHLMRLMWREHGKPEKPYTNEDIRRHLGELTKDQKFADDFFSEYVYGGDVVDYKDLLAHAGFLLRKEKPNRAFLGAVRLNFEDGTTIVNSPTIIGTPLYRVGVDRGDKILSIDSVKLASSKDWERILSSHKPGDRVKIEYEPRGSKQKTEIAFDAQPDLEIVSYERASQDLTDAIKAFRSDWLGSKSPHKHAELVKYCPTCRRSFPFRFEFCQFDGDTLSITRRTKEDNE